MSKGFWGVIIIVILIFVGIFAIGGHKTANAPDKKSSGTPSQHVQGQGKAGITLVEYGDYQCPFCGQYYPIVKQVQAEFKDQIYFQFRNYPLVNLHPNAFSAARAAEAAAMQNKFWEMHDALYETQDQWASMSDASPFFSQLAQQLGLNVTQFKKDYSSSKVNDLINADMAAGNKLGITGTPTFFINGKKIDVTENAASFEKAINAAIASKKQSD